MPAGRPKADRQLPHCREEGISCHQCVTCAAGKLATVASQLHGSAVKQLFFAMYTAEPCRPMVGAFVLAFQEQQKRHAAQITPEVAIVQAAVA